VAFASVLREAAHAIGDAPSLLPQRYVFSLLASTLEKGNVPHAADLSHAWEEGENHVINISAFRGNFLGAVDASRKDPETLFATIRDTATLANNKAVKHLSLNFVQEFQQLKKMTNVLALRYAVRNDQSAAVKQFIDRLDGLQKMLNAVTQEGFNPNAAENKHFFGTLYLQATKVLDSYKAMGAQRVAALQESYADYAEQGDAGVMQWLAEVIDEVREQHPVFSVTHIPSIYHRSLLKVTEALGMASATAVEGETAQQRYIRETARDLVSYLKTGDIAASEILDTTAEQKVDYFEDLPVRFAHVDAGHDVMMKHKTVTATEVEQGERVMQPEQGVPTQMVSGGEANEIDRMIKESEQGIGRGGAGVTRGAGAFSYFD